MTSATMTKKSGLSLDMKEMDPRIRAAAVYGHYPRLLSLREEIKRIEWRARNERPWALEGVRRRLGRVHVLIAQLDFEEAEKRYETWVTKACEVANTRGMSVPRKTDLLERTLGRAQYRRERMWECATLAGGELVKDHRIEDLKDFLQILKEQREARRQRKAEQERRRQQNLARRAEENRQRARAKGVGSKKK